MKPWYLYIVECKDGTLYTGITTDIKRRIRAHNSGRGAKYTRGKGPVTLRHLREFKNRSDATKAELKTKKLRRSKKLSIIEKFALPGDLVELTGRYTGKKQRYAMVIKIRDYAYAKYVKEGAAIYDMSDGTTGFSYAYTRVSTGHYV